MFVVAGRLFGHSSGGNERRMLGKMNVHFVGTGAPEDIFGFHEFLRGAVRNQ
jgi:hypothetical protein